MGTDSLVTSLHSDPYAQELRTQNLKKLFGEDTFIEYYYLDCGADKDEILEELSHKYYALLGRRQICQC